MGTVDGFAIYRDGQGITHVACCYRDAGGPWTFLRCDATRDAGVLVPGDVDALQPWPTCLACAGHELP